MAPNVMPVQDPARERSDPAGRPEGPRPGLLRRAVVGLLKTLVPLVLLAGAGKLCYDLYLTAPVAERQPRARVPRLVEVTEVHPAPRGPRIEAWGEVAAARTLVLRPETGGTITGLSPNLTPGGLVAAGEELIRLDDREQRLAIAQAEAEIRQIEARIALEEGQHERARRDLKRLPGELTEAQRNLVLRTPQMDELKGQLAVAEAAREQAEVDLSRTVIRAPFDALVVSEEVAPGAMLTAGAAAANLVAADRFHVTVAVPVSELDWIDLSAGQILRLTQPGVWPEDAFREGRIERLAAGLSEAGRMAEVVVAVDDPLARLPENRGKPRLLLGSFLQALGEGRVVEDAYVLDRAYLRDRDKVWVMSPDDTLEIRTVSIAWRGAREVLVSGGLEPRDRVVTTPLAVVADGMKLRVREPAALQADGTDAATGSGAASGAGTGG